MVKTVIKSSVYSAVQCTAAKFFHCDIALSPLIAGTG